jgi:hypothetical protein
MILLCSTQLAKTVHINELETYSISPWFIFCYFTRTSVEIGPIRWAPDTETRKTKATAFLSTFLPTWLASAEKGLSARGGEWYATSGLTYADLAMQVSISTPADFSYLQSLKNAKSVSPV